MRNLLTILIAALCLIALPLQAQAAKSGKAAKSSKVGKLSKERLVLMELRLSEGEKNLQGAMETALLEGLQQKYEVFAGEQVKKKAKEIFNKESRTAKHDCNETRCMQDIAEAFQAELIATASVTKQDGGYFLSLKIENIFDNKAVYSKSLPCEGCSSFQAVDKLKELSGTVALTIAPVDEDTQPKANLNDPESALWSEVQKGNTGDDYAAYLAQYPKGKFVVLAKSRKKKLQDQAAIELAQQDQNAWDEAKNTATVEGYSNYIEQYPRGNFLALAKSGLKKLEEGNVGENIGVNEEQAIWNDAESEEDFQDYLREYPKGRFVKLAKIRIAKFKKEQIDNAKNAGKGIVMVRIPGKNYEMGKYEVTQKEWRAVMGNNPSKFTSCGDNCPVEQVSWDDIQIFLQKLNAKTGRQYRLPTQDEWEEACHAGGETKFCGDNEIEKVSWYSGNSNQSTNPAGQKKANGFGLYDMSGNVWEWVSDCSNDTCVLKGGGWNDSAEKSESDSGASYQGDDIGFRLARTRL